MHTVIETPAYLRSAQKIGMTTSEMTVAVDTVSADPLAGDLIVGSGGCRKVRIAGRGFGKSGGYRVVTYFAIDAFTVFLIAVLSKGSDANFSDAQVNAMAKAVPNLADGIGVQRIK